MAWLKPHMESDRFQKLFGIGPVGAAISLLFLGASAWAARRIDVPILPACGMPVKVLGAGLVIVGLGLHCWSFWTLRHWWAGDRLCTMGPFAYFRHPMYAAWITFVSSGMALYLNSWIYVVWVLSLHPIWHWLVRKEELAMTAAFGDSYREYAERTGRFVPQFRRQGFF